MNATNKQPTTEVGGLRPASLADSELDHLERIVQYVTRSDKTSDVCQLDHEYWEKRVRALGDTHDLVATQRRRVVRLLELLEREALVRTRGRTVS